MKMLIDLAHINGKKGRRVVVVVVVGKFGDGRQTLYDR